jgi:uncharacterized RDD family membrane protein YckC
MTIITATDYKTGKGYYFDGTQWQQFTQTASNESTGERVGLLNNEWILISKQSKDELFYLQDKVVNAGTLTVPSQIPDNSNMQADNYNKTTIAVIALLACLVVGIIFFLLKNRNTKNNHSELNMNKSKYASLWTRTVGAAIDVCVLFVVSYAICYVWTSNAHPSEAYLSPELTKELWKSRFILTWLVSDLIYSVVLMTSSFQGTLGQKAVGIKVVKDNGEKIGHGAAIGRNLMSLLSSIFLKIGYVMAAVREDKKTLHDLVAGTVVIDSNKERSTDKAAITSSPELGTPSRAPTTNNTAQPITKASTSTQQGYELSEKKSSPAVTQNSHLEKTTNEPLAEDWENALIEFERGNQVKGLWAKIYADNNGDENISKAQYIKIRAAELAGTRRKKIAEDRENMYAQAPNDMCIRNGALAQIQLSSSFPIYKLANGNYAIYANWKYKIYSDLDSLNKALEMHGTCELFSKEGFIEDIAA